MKILVDADACPVKEIIEEAAGLKQLEVVMVSNPSHLITSSYARVVVVDGGSQASDLYIVNKTCRDDVVVTQDYGLASLVLARQGHAIHPSGRIFTADNIDSLLMNRYINAKARQAGYRTQNPTKRNKEDDERFRKNFKKLLGF